MRIEVTIPNAVQLAPAVWQAPVAPEEVARLGKALAARGDVSIVYLPEDSAPRADSTSIRFEPSRAIVANAGSGRSMLVVFGAEATAPLPVRQLAAAVDEVGSPILGLRKEIAALPKALATAGRELVDTICGEFPGTFQKFKSGKYVYRPNFWTIKVQPYDVSLAITVYGTPSSFGLSKSIEIKPDQNSYSRFKLESAAQVDRAIEIVRLAAKSRQR